jgi:hypothetical protein
MSDTPDEPTVENEPVETEPAADFAPPRPEDAAPVTARSDGVDTVTRRGAALAMAGCLVVGLLLGWAVASATGDDSDSQPISFQDGGPGPARGDVGGGPEGGWGRGFPGPSGPGAFPGGPGRHFDHHHGGGFPGGPPEQDDYDDYDDYDEHDDGDSGEQGTDEQQDEDDDGSTTTTEQGGN